MKLIRTFLAWVKSLQTSFEQDQLASEVNEKTCQLMLDNNDQ